MHIQRFDGLRVRAGLSVALILAVAAAGPVAAAGRGAIVVTGIQHEYGSCEDAGDPGYLMTGNHLDGCWVVETFDVKRQFDGKAHFMATGVERFVGTIDGISGTFYTRYVYTAKTIGDWTNFLEVHGRCHHPITGGIGGFAGISGELSFTDVVDTDPPYYPYWGNIRLDGASSSSTTRSAGTATTSGTGSNGATC